MAHVKDVNDDVDGKGFAVIIVNRKNNRIGAEHEMSKLWTIFKDYLGFNVICYPDLTGEEMTAKLKKGVFHMITQRVWIWVGN